MTRKELMRKAIELSIENIANGGGPFGAVIARDGEIIATGVNRVTSELTPHHTPKSTPYAMHAGNSTHLILPDARSTPHVSHARCVWERSTGRTSTKYTTATPRPTRKKSALMTRSSTTNLLCPTACAAFRPRVCSPTRQYAHSAYGMKATAKSNTDRINRQ